MEDPPRALEHRNSATAMTPQFKAHCSGHLGRRHVGRNQQTEETLTKGMMKSWKKGSAEFMELTAAPEIADVRRALHMGAIRVGLVEAHRTQVTNEREGLDQSREGNGILEGSDPDDRIMVTYVGYKELLLGREVKEVFRRQNSVPRWLVHNTFNTKERFGKGRMYGYDKPNSLDPKSSEGFWDNKYVSAHPAWLKSHSLVKSNDCKDCALQHPAADTCLENRALQKETLTENQWHHISAKCLRAEPPPPTTDNFTQFKPAASPQGGLRRMWEVSPVTCQVPAWSPETKLCSGLDILKGSRAQPGKGCRQEQEEGSCALQSSFQTWGRGRSRLQPRDSPAGRQAAGLTGLQDGWVTSANFGDSLGKVKGLGSLRLGGWGETPGPGSRDPKGVSASDSSPTPGTVRPRDPGPCSPAPELCPDFATFRSRSPSPPTGRGRGGVLPDRLRAVRSRCLGARRLAAPVRQVAGPSRGRVVGTEGGPPSPLLLPLSRPERGREAGVPRRSPPGPQSRALPARLQGDIQCQLLPFDRRQSPPGQNTFAKRGGKGRQRPLGPELGVSVPPKPEPHLHDPLLPATHQAQADTGRTGPEPPPHRHACPCPRPRC
ncbi:PREDICTED: uncharacterized protein LOC102010123 [Chinchilla lanigera]|uniref:uncharacterized protein LOC102010123 n=1 Tax=Chinchilla lanigera TaxID=34839 RepID=UPI00069771D2|nr:PREDICTED: uncharacterized protein LOC102010123 [Chinchilla lanigera]